MISATSPLLEIDIRKAIHNGLHSASLNKGEIFIVDELGIDQGKVIADVVAVNGTLHGMEIKSDSDTLSRLPKQILAYDKVFNQSAVVVVKRHLAKAMSLIPEHWGVVVASRSGEDVVLTQHRLSSPNEIRARDLAELLWKDEAVDVLKIRGAAKGLASKKRKLVWDRLAEVLTHEEIYTAVAEALKLGTLGRKRKIADRVTNGRFKKYRTKN